jgi:hypothetical protein
MIAPSRKKKFKDVLTAAYFQGPKDTIKVSDGEIDDLYLLVISPKFRGLGMGERNSLIWTILQERLSPEEWGQISMTVARTPDERDPLENLR